MKKAAKFILLFVLSLSLFTPSQSVHADVAPPPEVELGGLQPPQFQKTEVAMLYERVEMELGLYYDETTSQSIQNRVVVNAYFVMQNQGSVDETMQAVFPAVSAPICRAGYVNGDTFTYYSIVSDSFQVNIDGTNVSTSTLHAPYGDCEDYPWLAFNVTFPVNKQVLVKISYVMETENVDKAQNINYILETGAGWKGKIGRGYIIFKFPYTVTTENILSATTKGYQTLYNEIFWSFQDFEPTSDDNIQISIVSPNTWFDILGLRDQIKTSPQFPKAWFELITNYKGIAYSEKGTFTRDKHYADLVDFAYEKAIAVNPSNSELFADYAAHKLFGWSPYGEPISANQAGQVVPLLNKALALDPNNETALYVLSALRYSAPFITFTLPATIPPTATSQFTATPSITPSTTITPIPTETPVVVKVTQTKLVTAPTSTPKPEVPTVTSVPTEIPAQDEMQKETSTIPLVFGAIILFIAGIGVGTFWQRRRMSS